MLKDINHSHDTPEQAANKFINAAQHLRCDCEIMRQSKKNYKFNQDDLKIMQALLREFTDIYNKQLDKK